MSTSDGQEFLNYCSVTFPVDFRLTETGDGRQIILSPMSRNKPVTVEIIIAGDVVFDLDHGVAFVVASVDRDWDTQTTTLHPKRVFGAAIPSKTYRNSAKVVVLAQCETLT